MVCKVLATRATVERHTGENLASEVNAILEERHLQQRLFACIHDNAANITLAGTLITGTPDRPAPFNIGCAAHNLNLSIKDAMTSNRQFETMVAAARKLVGHFKMSTVATNGLKAKTKDIMTDEHHNKKLIQDVPTRWNSVFAMLERLVLLRWPVVAVLSDRTLTKLSVARALDLQSESWILAEELLPALRLVELATVLFSSQAHSTPGVVMPAITGLVKQLEAMVFSESSSTDARRAARSCRPGAEFRDALVTSLTKRFHLEDLDFDTEDLETTEEVPFHVLASFADPRFRDLDFLDKNQKESIVDFATSMAQAMPRKSSWATTTASTDEPPKKKSKSEVAMFELLRPSATQSSTADTALNIKQEVVRYAQELPISVTEDPLEWWRENAKRYPTLGRLAERLLAAPPTSVPSEQVFSKAGLLVRKQRASLKPAIVDALIFLSKNKM